MKRLMLLFILFAVPLYSDDFQTQEDSFFVPMRTKIYWSLASSAGSGLADGYQGLHNGVSYDLEWMRLAGRVKPENKFLKYIFLDGCISYNKYNTGENIHELINSHLVLGLGLRISQEPFWEDIVPYLGAGAGYSQIFDKLNISSAKPEVRDNGGLSYVQQGGLEYWITDTLVFFVEESYLWANILNRNNYIPNSEWGNSFMSSEYTYHRNFIELRQITIKAGFRFYWGKNLFWFFPFFWEK